MRWLVVSPYLPHPAIGHGGGTAVLQLCRALARVHDTRLLCFRREREVGLESSLVDAGVDVHTVDFRSEQATGPSRLALMADRALHALRATREGRPLMVAKYDRAVMHARLREQLAAWKPDVVQVEYGFMAPYARTALDARDGAAPHVLLNTHELGSLVRLRRAAAATSRGQRTRRGRDLAEWARHESSYVHWADTVGCVTEGDRRVLEAMTAATNLVTLPLGTEVEAFAPLGPGHTTHPPRLLFVGSFAHPPNAEGAERFLTEVLPRIRARHPEVVTEIIGANPPEALRRRADGRVELPGFVDDLDAAFRRAQVFVAPLFSGGGIKIKVLEAMGRGAAIVTTPIGAEGIDPDGTACRVASDPATFADAVSDLLDDPGARSELGRRARALVEAHYSWPAIVRRLEERVQSSQARQGGTGRSSP